MSVIEPTFNSSDLHTVLSGADRPLLLTDATVYTLDPTIGTIEHADVLIGGGLVVGVGPGLLTAASDDGMVVVRATGTAIVPAAFDVCATLSGAGGRTIAGTLAPEAPAHLFVVTQDDGPDAVTALHVALSDPSRLRAVLRDGVPMWWNGAAVVQSSNPESVDGTTQTTNADPVDRVGVWIDTQDFLHQELTADGRYDETRGGRKHAYQGRYWLDGDRIDYLDDLGFWAFGRFDGDTLHHAGYVMRRGQTC